MRTKYCRPLSKPKSVPLSYWESEAEQTYLLLFTLTKGNVKHCIPRRGDFSNKMTLYMRSLNYILEVSIPCSKGGLECAQEAKGNLQSPVMEPTAALTFQYKGVRHRL